MNDFESLSEIIAYDSDTGEFTNKKDRPKCKAGKKLGVKCNGYVYIWACGKYHYAHRLAWLLYYGNWPTNQIDHINNIKTDNRIKNLRDVSNGINQQNRSLAKKHSKSGVLGVFFHKKANKWSAQIGFDKKYKHLGLFTSIEDAREAYITAKKELHDV